MICSECCAAQTACWSYTRRVVRGGAARGSLHHPCVLAFWG